jgi:hypothetical protein
MPLIVPLITKFLADIVKLPPDARERRIHRMLEALRGRLSGTGKTMPVSRHRRRERLARGRRPLGFRPDAITPSLVRECRVRQ